MHIEKRFKLPGTSLEICTPSISNDTLCGRNNYPGMVKETNIGKSAAKFLGKVNIYTKKEVQRLQ
jgi:hypothetical protein